MSRRIILAIVALMTIALIGLVTLQVYWVGNALRLKEQEFNPKVYQALAEVVESNEDKLMQKTWGGKVQHFVQDGTPYFIIDGDTTKMPNIKENMNVNVDMIMDDPRLLYFGSSIPGSMEENFEEISRYQEFNKNVQDRLKQKQAKEYRKMVFQKILGGMSATTLSDDEKFDVEFIEQKLREKLQTKGIDLDFKFGILQPGQDSIITTHEVDPEKLQETTFKAELFPHSFLMSTATLSVYFPKKFTFLLESLIFRMLSSVVLILIIIFSFAFTIYTIYRQKKISEMKNDFINNMTHEFKTPITTISLAGQALSDKSIAQDESRVERFSRMIMDETNKLGLQVEKILQMAIVDKGDFKMKIKEVDIHKIIERVAENQRLRLQNENAYILVNLDATHTSIMGDEMHLSNLIDNLIDNAVKYCQMYPEVKINTKNGNGGILIFVEDHGIGMSADTQKKIFDRFYRVPTGNIHDVKGFGLGLAYVKTIVDAHGGRINLTSELNKGSKFKIFLPYNHFEK